MARQLEDLYSKTVECEATIANIVIPNFIGINKNYNIKTNLISPVRRIPEGDLIKPVKMVDKITVLKDITIRNSDTSRTEGHMYLIENLETDGFKPGDKIKFHATVENYSKGKIYDYSLNTFAKRKKIE